MISSSIFKFFLWFCFYIRLYQSSPQCLDQNGDPVDWFVIYKLPIMKNNIDANIAAGVGYSFITSKMVNESWQLADHNITDSKSLPGRTLFPAYLEKNNNNVTDIFWLLYNDQPPSKSYNSIRAHAKGIIIGDKDGGIWITHSVPHFPSIDDLGYRYPQTGHVYGQSFLCVNLNKENLNELGNQLMVNWVNVYDHKLDDNFSTIYPSLSMVAQMKQIETVQRKTVLRSVGNVQFTSFAKSLKFKKDLYSKWVAQVLRVILFVETWLHDSRLPSDCSTKFEVHNVDKISMNTFNCQFLNSKDHSKFAVSVDVNNPWVCIGDINRQLDQLTRGGGTVCFQNTNVWLSYLRIVAVIEFCPKKYDHY